MAHGAIPYLDSNEQWFTVDSILSNMYTATAEESRRHEPAPGDHYRALYHSAFHRDVRVVQAAGPDHFIVACEDLGRKNHDMVELSRKQLRPSWSGLSGYAYLGPWVSGAQLRQTPENLFRAPIDTIIQPEPAEGQVWFSLRRSEKLRVLEVIAVSPGEVYVRRTSPQSNRVYNTSILRHYWYPSPKGTRGYLFGFHTMAEYEESQVALNLDEYIDQLVDLAGRQQYAEHETYDVLAEIL